MIKLFEKIKNKIRGSAEPIKQKTEIISKTMGQKTHKVAETVAEKGKGITASISEKTPEIAEKTKQIATSVVEKTGETVTIGKLKVKLYNLNRQVEKGLSKIGGRTFEILNQKQADVYQDEEILALIKNLEKVKNEIKTAEKEMKKVGSGEKAIHPGKEEKS